MYLISFFKKKLLECFAELEDAAFDACLAVVKECWSPGGPLSQLSRQTAERGTKAATAAGGVRDNAPHEGAARLALLAAPRVLRAPRRRVRMALRGRRRRKFLGARRGGAARSRCVQNGPNQ